MKKEMTPAELEVMRAVWNVIEEGNVANTRSVRKKVNERREDKLYGQVVYCHIEHLQQKGYVKVMRTEEGDRYYVPLMEKREFMEKQARGWADYWDQNPVEYAMLALGRNLTKEEKESLRSYLDELDRGEPSGTGGQPCVFRCSSVLRLSCAEDRVLF